MITAGGLRERTVDRMPLPITPARAPATLGGRSDSLCKYHPIPSRPVALHLLLLWTWWDKKKGGETDVLMVQRVLQHSEKKSEIKSN